MDFTKSALFLDVSKVLRYAKDPTGVLVDITIHPDDQTVVKPLRFLSRDYNQDFGNNYSDIILVTVAVTGSDFAKVIYPNRSNLYITMKDTLTGVISGEILKNSFSYTERYKAIMLDDQGNPILEHVGRNSVDTAQLDLNEVREVTFQLLSQPINQLRMMNAGRVFHRTTGEKLIRSIFSEAFGNLNLDEGVRPLGIDIAKIDNETQYQQLIIPHGTLLPEIPDLLQNKLCGLYNAGLGNYYTRRYWRIFPLYNTDRQEQLGKSLTIINVPATVLPSVEKTYMTEGEHTTVLATGTINFADESEQRQLNDGNALRFADANNFIENRATVEGNKLFYKRNKNVTEVTTAQRGDNLNFAPVTSTRITANVFAEYSRMVRREGGIVTLMWEFANPYILEPGMSLKLLYLDGDRIRELKGTLVAVQSYTHSTEKITFSKRFRTNCALAIFVNRRDAYL